MRGHPHTLNDSSTSTRFMVAEQLALTAAAVSVTTLDDPPDVYGQGRS